MLNCCIIFHILVSFDVFSNAFYNIDSWFSCNAWSTAIVTIRGNFSQFLSFQSGEIVIIVKLYKTHLWNIVQQHQAVVLKLFFVFFFRIRYNVPVNLYHGYGNGRGFELWSVCGNVSKWASSCLSVIVPVSTLFRCWKRFIGSRTIVVARKCRALWASYYGVSTVHLGVRFQRMEPAFLWNVLTVKTTGQGHIINAWISIKSRQSARNNKNIAMGLKMRIIV